MCFYFSGQLFRHRHVYVLILSITNFIRREFTIDVLKTEREMLLSGTQVAAISAVST